jgi:hypothetical protein
VSRTRHYPRRKTFSHMLFLRRLPVTGLPNVYAAEPQVAGKARH